MLSITLHLGPHGPDNVLRVARVFMAINESKELLRKLYRELLGYPSLPSQQVKPLWPNPTLDPPTSTTQLPKLEFYCKVNRANGEELPVIDDNNQRHGMYLARNTSNEVVLVKFAAKYNEEAHRLLADEDLAPKLYFCARVIGDMYMVVMEYIPKSRGWSLDPLSSVDPPPSRPKPEVIRRCISRALGLLHERHLVFGDLREANSLYLPENGGRVLLVDFDGVGRDGTDRYSPCLNPDLNLGVERWQIMEKGHDDENLERMMKRVSGRYPSVQQG